MAKSKSDASAGGLILLVVIALLLPFLIVTIGQYLALRRKHLVGRDVTRIVDFGRAAHRISYGISGMMLLVIGVWLAAAGIDKNPILETVVMTVFGAGVVFVGIQTGRAFAAGLLGVVIDQTDRTLTFPSDGVLRSYSSFSTVLNSLIPASVETIPVSSITGMTRQAGKTLLLQGTFGSRAITFSDKLRRDELLGRLSGARRYRDYENAGEGDYA